MRDELDAFLRGLAGSHDVNAQHAEIEALVSAGSVAAVTAMARALEERQDLDAAPWALEAVFDHLVRCLALTPSAEHAAAVLELLEVERQRTRQRPLTKEREARQAAALLGQAQTPETCVALAATPASTTTRREAIACWAQELVVRGHDLTGAAAIVGLWEGLGEALHPLGGLPLSRLPVEAGLRDVLWTASPRGGSAALPFGPRDDRRPALGLVSRSGFEERIASADLRAAVETWVAESNGVVEHRSFALDPPVTAFTPATLLALPLRCLERTRTLSVVRIDTARALQLLFAASAYGGAYTSGELGAYGRLNAWRSLAALVGEPAGRPLAAVAAAAESAALYEVSADGDWFYQVAWDLGIACLGPGGSRLNVLAATDTD